MSQATLPADPYLNSNLFSGYYLDERVADLDAWACDETAREAFDQLCDLWELEGPLVDSYKEDELLDAWIDEVLDILGFGTLSEPTLPDSEGYNDRLLFESAEARRDGALKKKAGDVEAMYASASALLEAKQWDANFSERFSEQRSYRDASHQIKYYLERTPEDVRWGILTDGRKWRLYGTKDYATETYYEVDLPELLESGSLEAFKYFFVFFRPAAFRETAGTSFLDRVWSESETAAQELGEDLQDNVFTALRVLGEGFVETNTLDLDPGDEAARNQLKEQSLVLLYRLMFVLYAESRGLIHPDDPAAEDEYERHFSLTQLRSDIHEEISSGGSFDSYSEFSTSMWSRLEDLFGLVNAGEESLGIPPYNGGLFDPDEHEFLATNAVADRYIAEVVYRLGTTEDDDGEFVLADYADLDTRHLGSIYEGLLEHEFRIAPEQYAAVAADGGQVWKPATEVSVADAVETVERGGLYVVNDEGERKATGAYYTPDYVVAYIVEETVDPLLADIKADLESDGLDPSDGEYFFRFFESVRQLRVLDPAMGSGHFLTKATAYLTEQVMEVAREQEKGFGEDEIRRKVAKECIYGVDINGMAVELAKLSMWLETLAADQPLAFLDHHLKPGNSLVGSDVTDVLSNGEDEEGGQLTLTQAFARTRRRTLDHVMDRMQELLAIDNETLSDIKSMEEIYDDIRADPLYQRLFELTNVHTAEQFGLDVPEGAYERMAAAIEDETDWAVIAEEDWFRSAQAMAAEETFFHWQLEFPEVFFNVDGELMEESGFDAVVSNPPYIRIQNLRKNSSRIVEYLLSGGVYETTEGRFDIYSPFVEKGAALSTEGRVCYILPNKFFERKHGKHIRNYLTENKLLSDIVDFGQYQIFDGVTTYTCILSLHEKSEKFSYAKCTDKHSTTSDLQNLDRIQINIGDIDDSPWILAGPEEQQVLNRIDRSGYTVGELSEEIAEGITSGDNDIFFVEIIDDSGAQVVIRSPANDVTYYVENELIKPLVDGDSVARYQPPVTEYGVIYPYENVGEEVQVIPEDRLKDEFPLCYDYLSDFRERLSTRGTEVTNKEYTTWYALYRARKMGVFEQPKLLTPDVCGQSEFTMDDTGGFYFRNSAFGFVPQNNTKSVREFFLSVLNSSVTWFYIYQTSTVLENDFRRFTKAYLSPLPIPEKEPHGNPEKKKEEYDEIFHEDLDSVDLQEFIEPTTFLAYLGRKLYELNRKMQSLNRSLLDHLGSYSDGESLSEIGFTQPPAGAADSILQQTATERPNLRIGRAEVHRESEGTVEIRLTARYKPDNEDAHETDRWGYTETDPLPAVRITDLTATEADLIEAFVPVAVSEGGGFAGFRETATKTNSPVDRLRKLTLPAVGDVEDELAGYRETMERAAELEEKIERTDELIDAIVYELYGLTDEEIEIVEEAVGE